MTTSPPELTIGSRAGIRVAFFCALLAGLSAVLLFAIAGWFLTAAAIAGAGGAITIAAFNYLIPSAAIRALAIVRTGARYGERLLAHRAALIGMAGLRAALFARLAAADGRVADDLSGGDASARLIADIAGLEDLIIRRPTRPASLIAALAGVALALVAGWRAALVLGLALAMLPWLLANLARRWTRAPAREAAAALGELRSRFVAYAAARGDIIAYGVGARIIADLDAEADRLARARTDLFAGEAQVAATMALYGAVAATLVLLTARGSAAGIALALLAAGASVEAMAAFARTALRQASVEEALDRLAALMALPPPASTPTIAITAPPATIGIGTVLLPPGARVALTGPSGSGKTRLIEALAGMRRAVTPLTMDGVAIDSMTQSALAAQCALSPQDATLIAGTVADNLRLARPGVTPAAMIEVLTIACLDGWVAAQTDGIDHQLGEDGGSLSGGERKRLSLARALLAGRAWLLLDEPTEGLDAATERTVIDRLGAWLDRTGTGLILTSHRPAPLALTDRRIAVATLPLAP